MATLVELQTPIILPDYPPLGVTVGYGAVQFLLDSISPVRPKAAVMLQVPKDGVLDGVEFYTGFVSAPSTVKISFQGVVNGLPDETPTHWRTYVGGSFANGGWNTLSASITDDGTDGGNKKTVSQGDFLAVVMEWDSTQSGRVWMYGPASNGSDHQMGAPYYAIHNGTSWSISSSGGFGSLALRYSGDVFHSLRGKQFPFSGFGTTSINTGTSPDEAGIRFKLPVAHRVCGYWWLLNPNGGDYDVIIYDDSNNVVTSISVEAEFIRNGTGTSFTEGFFAESVELQPNTVYRLVIKPTTGTSVVLQYGNVNRTAIMNAIGIGSEWYATSRSDAGSFSDVTTRKYFGGLLIDGIATGPTEGEVPTIPGGFSIPEPPISISGTPAFSALTTLDSNSSSEYAAWIIRAPKSGILGKFGFRIGALTTAEDLRVSFRTVNTGTFFPDATDQQYVDIPKASLAADSWVETPYGPTDDGTSGGDPRTVNAGDVFAVVVKFPATAGNLAISAMVGWGDSYEFPYTVVQGATPSPNVNAISLQYDDGSFAEFGGAVIPWSNYDAITINTGSTPDEVGNVFIPPVDMKVDGCWARNGGNGTVKWVLYDSDGSSVLAQTAAGFFQYSGSTPEYQLQPFTSGSVTLRAGETYRLVCTPTTGTSVVAQYFDVPTAAHMDACPLGGSMYSTSRTDGGAWTDLNTRRYLMGLRVCGLASEVEVEAEGGGGAGMVNLSGLIGPIGAM